MPRRGQYGGWEHIPEGLVASQRSGTQTLEMGKWYISERRACQRESLAGLSGGGQNSLGKWPVALSRGFGGQQRGIKVKKKL